MNELNLEALQKLCDSKAAKQRNKQNARAAVYGMRGFSLCFISQ
ncbi:MAG: hypothetical protein VZS12_08670 [Ruminococcus bromii]|nr:hypothetical protein [Ruminococcus bromii]